LEAYGDRAEEVRRAIAEPGGWSGILERYVEAAQGR
jgi:hypothetical protein